MQTFDKYPFLFSDAPYWKWRRHLSFWVFWWLFQAFLYSFIAVNNPYEYPKRLASSSIESLLYLSAHIFLAYFIIYFIIPRYLLRQRYLLTIAWVVFAFLVAALLSGALSLTLIAEVRSYFLLEQAAYYKRPLGMALFLGWMAGLRGAITIGGIAGAIKLMKYWYVKEKTNQRLIAENAQNQLELLKAQVHPHFLFNTLNNIYSHAQQTAPTAANMILELSDMLRYMLYETGHSSVPLSKEITLLKNYIGLEGQRYGNNLDLQFRTEVPSGYWEIAPLLLLPLLENAFKHGASQAIEHPWISFDLRVDDKGRCTIKVLNGQPLPEKRRTSAGGGLGLANFQKRLDILYPGHNLQIINEDDIFAVNLELTLQPTVKTTQYTMETHKTPAYARS
ncbi:MAG: sensor histidine kinase [Chitinophagaceae bacterium]|nr:sensor histidine kinase [Chitinophagaceae bacterium]